MSETEPKVRKLIVPVIVSFLSVSEYLIWKITQNFDVIESTGSVSVPILALVRIGYVTDPCETQFRGLVTSVTLQFSYKTSMANTSWICVYTGLIEIKLILIWNIWRQKYSCEYILWTGPFLKHTVIFPEFPWERSHSPTLSVWDTQPNTPRYSQNSMIPERSQC